MSSWHGTYLSTSSCVTYLIIKFELQAEEFSVQNKLSGEFLQREKNLMNLCRLWNFITYTQSSVVFYFKWPTNILVILVINDVVNSLLFLSYCGLKCNCHISVRHDVSTKTEVYRQQ